MIIAFTQCFNEQSSGNLQRWLNNVRKYADIVIAFDDGSTDGSKEILFKECDFVVAGLKNDWKREIYHKKYLLEIVQGMYPEASAIMWTDCDEICSKQLIENMKSIVNHMIDENIDGISFPEEQLYLSETWVRKDNLFDSGRFCRLWNATRPLIFDKREGLHNQQYPDNIYNISASNLKVIHYGFSSLKNIINKVTTYKNQGQEGYALNRLFPIGNLELEPVDLDIFPDENRPVKIEERPKSLIEKEWEEILNENLISKLQ